MSSRPAALLPHRRDPRAQRQVLPGRVREGPARRGIPIGPAHRRRRARRTTTATRRSTTAPLHRAVRQAVRLVPGPRRPQGVDVRLRRRPVPRPAASKLRPTCSASSTRIAAPQAHRRVQGVPLGLHVGGRRRRAEHARLLNDRAPATPTSRCTFDKVRFGRDYFLGGTLQFDRRGPRDDDPRIRRDGRGAGDLVLRQRP